jgi:hypothetical protein
MSFDHLRREWILLTEFARERTVRGVATRWCMSAPTVLAAFNRFRMCLAVLHTQRLRQLLLNTAGLFPPAEMDVIRDVLDTQKRLFGVLNDVSQPTVVVAVRGWLAFMDEAAAESFVSGVVELLPCEGVEAMSLTRLTMPPGEAAPNWQKEFYRSLGQKRRMSTGVRRLAHLCESAVRTLCRPRALRRIVFKEVIAPRHRFGQAPGAT